MTFLFWMALSLVWGEVIHLRNGRILKGKVLRQTATTLRIQTHAGAFLDLPRGQVKSVEKQDPAELEREAILGQIQAEHFERAALLLEDGLSKNPGDKELKKLQNQLYQVYIDKRIAEGKALLKEGRFDQAVQTLTPVLKAAPPGPSRHRLQEWLARVFVEQVEEDLDHVRFARAEETLSQAMAAGLRDARLHLLIARLHDNNVKPHLAAAEYKMALLLDPDNSMAKAGLAKAERKARRLGAKRSDPIDQAREMQRLGQSVEDRLAQNRRETPDFPTYGTLINAEEYRRIGHYISRDSRAFDDTVAEAAARYQVDPAWIKAIINAESHFQPRAKSPVGAKGLMQLMDGTAEMLGVKDSYNPRENILGGARYFRDNLRRFDDPVLALAAYNAGPGTVKIYNGIPPYKETQNYVKKVCMYYQYFKYEALNGGP